MMHVIAKIQCEGCRKWATSESGSEEFFSEQYAIDYATRQGWGLSWGSATRAYPVSYHWCPDCMANDERARMAFQYNVI